MLFWVNMQWVMAIPSWLWRNYYYLLHNNPEERSSQISTRLCKAVFRKQPEFRPNNWVLHNNSWAPSQKHLLFTSCGSRWTLALSESKSSQWRDQDLRTPKTWTNKTGSVLYCNSEARLCKPLLQWKSDEYYTTFVCVLVIQHAMHVRCIVICGLTCSTVFFNIIS